MTKLSMFGHIKLRKRDVFQKFCEWKTKVQKSFGRSVKVLCTDNGGVENYLKKEYIVHQLAIPKCPEQNGVAE